MPYCCNREPDFKLSYVRGTDDTLRVIVYDWAAVDLVGIGTATGGTGRILWRGVASAPIAYNASAATIQTVLRSIPGVPDGIVCSGGPLPSTAVEIRLTDAALQYRAADVLMANGSGLTGTQPGWSLTPTRESLASATQIRFTAKRSPSDLDSAAIIDLSLTGGGIAIGSPASELTINLTPASIGASVPWVPMVLHAGLQFTAAGKTRSIALGRLAIEVPARRAA